MNVLNTQVAHNEKIKREANAKTHKLKTKNKKREGGYTGIPRAATP